MPSLYIVPVAVTLSCARAGAASAIATITKTVNLFIALLLTEA
jgi:hypothetical protein